jgi:hypothetical protein
VIALPPSDGADHDTRADDAPPVAVTPVGAAGAEAGPLANTTSTQ